VAGLGNPAPERTQCAGSQLVVAVEEDEPLTVRLGGATIPRRTLTLIPPLQKEPYPRIGEASHDIRRTIGGTVIDDHDLE
jgi:hypothetical protein